MKDSIKTADLQLSLASTQNLCMNNQKPWINQNHAWTTKNRPWMTKNHAQTIKNNPWTTKKHAWTTKDNKVSPNQLTALSPCTENYMHASGYKHESEYTR